MGPVAADFASAAMIRVLACGMTALGLKPPVLTDVSVQAIVPLDIKRAVVQDAVVQGGLSCLPLLGRGLHALATEPTHLALTAGRDAADTLLRWQRLERYIHSRHRIQVQALGAHSALIRHESRDGGAPPWPVEDLVVCGVLCALLEANGLTEVQAHASQVPLYPQPDAQAITDLVASGCTAEWHLDWRPPVAAPAAQPVLSWPGVLVSGWSPLACAVANLLTQRLPQLIRLQEAADRLGMAPRSLQRALATEGLSFRRLLVQVRFRLAGGYLIHSNLSMAEVGFVCGYADQAHLTREFRQMVGMTPAKYRTHFQATPSQAPLM